MDPVTWIMVMAGAVGITNPKVLGSVVAQSSAMETLMVQANVLASLIVTS